MTCGLPRETSPAAKTEEKGLFSQAKEEFDRVFRELLGRLSRVCKL